jgi:hypothetical protein
MPPSPTWFDGREAVADALRRWIFGALRPASGYRVQATWANGQPAALFGPADEVGPSDAVQLLDVDAEGCVRGVTVFLDPKVAARFGRQSIGNLADRGVESAGDQLKPAGCSGCRRRGSSGRSGP